MKCYICDRDDDLINFDWDQQEFGPCTVCQAIIEETLEDFEEPDEGQSDLDYAEGGSRSRAFSSGVEPVSEVGRPFCETYCVPTGPQALVAIRDGVHVCGDSNYT